MSAAVTLSPASRRDFGPIKALVLDSVSSPLTKILYGKALDDFFRWRQAHGQPAFTRASLQAHRSWLEQQEYAPSTINQRLAALRKLAREAAVKRTA